MTRTRAITLHQPWATAVAYGPKWIETRSWPAPPAAIGERLLIHAAKRPPAEGDAWTLEHNMLGEVVCHLHEPYTEEQQAAHGRDPDGDLLGFPMPLGAIIASCTLAACVPMVQHIGQIGDNAPGIVPLDVMTLFREREVHGEDITDQLPWGHYDVGRWAWLLADIKSCDPIPCAGRQRIWWVPSPS